MACDRARCDHVASLPVITIPSATAAAARAAKSSPAAVLKAYADLVHNFIYSSADAATSPGSVDTASTRTASTTGVQSAESRGDRCAYNFNSGGSKDSDSPIASPTAGQHHSYRSVAEDECGRAGYRFSLIEVLSRLHDDGILHNDRHALPVIQTELQLVGGNQTSRYSPHHFHQCL